MAARAPASAAETQRVTITFRYSHFAPATVVIPAGMPVTVTLRNDDPIAHEWIVGDDAVHVRHRTGTEPAHDERPTEVSIPPLSERTTVVSFDEQGDYRFVCHLPGHEAYGMVGSVVVDG